ncbi:CRAL/TRIO domain-containing protein [Laetiporus sulphureus 93-53]|uniref:CRAL/TRIO domain-containing protein n=1 Tax=Laetiporus sulphureus 93-53 TaxID=1314785 RepID=A0A165GW88_9APHY|nr:CRAL/TRIO domain-containing protein [Laetiporus sulphureus 93-53]KZT10911.1 CRAL/TRIO domain-containing protein [Laetiporus sulphureus 93-53]
MALYDALRPHNEMLDELYRDNVHLVFSLQKTLLRDVLPDLAEELSLEAEEAQKLDEWLRDVASLFRILKRHRFVISFALEDARKILVWRALSFSPVIDSIPPFLRCFPSTCHDPFGRPVLFTKLAAMADISHTSKHALLQGMELLRIHMAQLNTDDQRMDTDTLPIFQYVLLLDIGNISVQNLYQKQVDLLKWFVQEVIPYFPGMLASVIVLNYSWTHSGFWNLLRRALPSSAMSRVFFPTESELLEYFSPYHLPSDFGGQLPPLTALDDPLQGHVRRSDDGEKAGRISAFSNEAPNIPHTNSTSQAAAGQFQSPTSPSNPFFGYPVRYGTPVPTLLHGRRRKRDLFRVLARLFWARWKTRVVVILGISVAFIIRRISRRTSWKAIYRVLQTAVEHVMTI